MDLLALKHRSQLLDDLLVQGRSPSASGMKDLLSLLVEAAPRTQSPRDLETILCLYRKWNVIALRHLTPNVIPALDRMALRKTYEPNPSITKRITFRFPRFERAHDRARLLAATEAVDPYGRHRENISAVDPAFTQSQTWDSILKAASDAFKRSALSDAEDKYISVVRQIGMRQTAKERDMYLLSWAYHDLGNIWVIRHNIGIARRLFAMSLHIKEMLPELPRLSLLQTQMKLSTVCRPDDNPLQVRRTLAAMLGTMTLNRDALEATNKLLFQNIETDILYHLARLELFCDEPSAFRTHIDNALHISESSSDIVGQVKNYVVLGMGPRVRWRSTLEYIGSLLSETTVRQRSDPYLRDILSFDRMWEVRARREDFATGLQSVFRIHHIRPIEDREPSGGHVR